MDGCIWSKRKSKVVVVNGLCLRGHGGGDFFTDYNFGEAIRTGEQPYFDVYKGLDMTLTGIQAYKSALANGAPFEIPDFRKEEVGRQQ